MVCPKKKLMPNAVWLFHYSSDNIPNHTHTQTQNAPKQTSESREDPSPSSEGLSKSLSRHDGYWIRSDQTQPTSPFDGALIANSVHNIPYSEVKETLQSLLLSVMAVVTVALPLNRGACLWVDRVFTLDFKKSFSMSRFADLHGCT